VRWLQSGLGLLALGVVLLCITITSGRAQDVANCLKAGGEIDVKCYRHQAETQCGELKVLEKRIPCIASYHTNNCEINEECRYAINTLYCEHLNIITREFIECIKFEFQYSLCLNASEEVCQYRKRFSKVIEAKNDATLKAVEKCKTIIDDIDNEMAMYRCLDKYLDW
jgi:hypothetical protein